MAASRRHRPSVIYLPVTLMAVSRSIGFGFIVDQGFIALLQSFNLTLLPAFSIFVFSSTPTTSSRTFPLRSTWKVIVRWPTLLMTPSTSTALDLVSFVSLFVAFASAGVFASATGLACAGVVFARVRPFVPEQMNTRLNPQRAGASRLITSRNQLFASLHSSEPFLPEIHEYDRRKFLELKAYFISNCQGASGTMALRKAPKQHTSESA